MIIQLLMSKELKEFVNDLIRVVYTVLDIFLAELEFYLDPRTPYLEPFGKEERMGRGEGGEIFLAVRVTDFLSKK